MKKRTLLLIFISVLLAGCNESDSSKNELKEKVEALEKKVDELETDLIVLKINQEQYNTATFDPAAGKGYQRIDTTSGTFLITLRDVTPHLDGVKVSLNIGNIQYASYSGFKLKVNYSRRYSKYDPNESAEERKEKRELLAKSKREKEESFTKTLKPATWNSVTVFLPDIKPSDFGRLTLTMITDTVSMSTN